MHYIDRISPVSNTVVVDWSMGSRCNYSCSYCPPVLHDGKSDWATLDQIQGFFDKLEEHYDMITTPPLRGSSKYFPSLDLQFQTSRDFLF